MLQLLRYLWASPNTFLGLIVTVWGMCLLAKAKWVDGVLEVSGGSLPMLLRPAPGKGIAAITLGHVVLAIDQAALDRTRFHERVHVRQYERWGPLFIPAYFIASAVAHFRGRHHYLDNRFEREAFRLTDAHRHTR